MSYFSNSCIKQGSWRTLALTLALAVPVISSAAEEEVPFWAIGMPKDGPGKTLAPVPSYPIPTAADQLPVAKIKLPRASKLKSGLVISWTHEACARVTRVRSL